MEIYLTLLSPLWWGTVVLCSALFATVTTWLARRRPLQTRQGDPGDRARRLRLGTWVAGLLVLANIAMFGTLAAANLRVPSIAGPVGLAFLLCCLVSLVLAVSLHAAAGRAEGVDAARPIPRGRR